MSYSNSVHTIHYSQNTYLEALRQEQRGQKWDLYWLQLVPEEQVYQQASDAGVIDIRAVDSVQNHPPDLQVLPKSCHDLQTWLQWPQRRVEEASKN